MSLARRLTSFLRPDAPAAAAAHATHPADAGPRAAAEPYQIAYEPDLLPSPALMRTEGIEVLEEWFRWGEEWSMLLRVFGRIRQDSAVLEIGCGLGRVAFPLRYVLSEAGTYDGFDICRYKIEFLERFHAAHSNFRFRWADVHNTHYNPEGTTRSVDFRFPYADGSFDLAFAASVYTHLLPDTTAHYFAETARVLRRGGRAVFSCFLLDHYRKGHPRPSGFDNDWFDVDHPYGDYGDDFAVTDPEDPERITAYRAEALERYAREAGLVLAEPPVAGLWSGTAPTWVGVQDLVVLEKP